MRIQRGVMPTTQLFTCGRKGLGLRLLENVKAGSFVGEYMGEIVTEQEYYMRRVVSARGFMGGLFGAWTLPAVRLWLAALP
jgi:hypothetical protein